MPVQGILRPITAEFLTFAPGYFWAAAERGGNSMAVDVWPGVFFRSLKDRSGRENTGDLPGDKPGESAADREPVIRCRQCLQEITRASARIIREGAHRHILTNPHGHVFEIGCFRSVMGCGYLGPPSTEFAWFAGYSWRVVYCGTCSTHLGWVFEISGQANFYGLILKQIVEPD